MSHLVAAPASTVFLHGGGDLPPAREVTFNRFMVDCLLHGNGPLLVVSVAADADELRQTAEYYCALFVGLGAPPERLEPLLISPDEQLSAGRVAALAPSGVFVCGGMTPAYHRALGEAPGWVDFVRQRGIPYCGTSAGAVIAAEQAVIGGWHTHGPDRPRQFLFPGAGEGLDDLTVRPGLGLVPFTVDVHAGQMGTLTRLVNAISCGAIAEGWALDEDTMLIVTQDSIEITGLGQAYHAVATAGGVLVRVVAPPVMVSR